MAKKGKSGARGMGKPSGAGPQIWGRGGSAISSRGKGNACGDMASAAKQPKGKGIIKPGRS